MISDVHSWKQAGRVFVWRYPPHKKKHRGWHITCDDAACDSLAKLVEAMRIDGRPGRRTIALTRASSEIWAVPNFGEPLREAHQSIVFDYEPSFPDLVLTEDDGRLRLRLGDERATTLIEAVQDLKAGRGDYTLPSNDDDAAPIWIWWMLKSK